MRACAASAARRTDGQRNQRLVRHGRHVPDGVHHLWRGRGPVSARTGQRDACEAGATPAASRAFRIGLVLRSAASDPRALMASGARLRRGRASRSGGTGGGSSDDGVASSNGGGLGSDAASAGTQQPSTASSPPLPPSLRCGEGGPSGAGAPREQLGPRSSNEGRGGRSSSSDAGPPPPRRSDHGVSARQKALMLPLRCILARFWERASDDEAGPACVSRHQTAPPRRVRIRALTPPARAAAAAALGYPPPERRAHTAGRSAFLALAAHHGAADAGACHPARRRAVLHAARRHAGSAGAVDAHAGLSREHRRVAARQTGRNTHVRARCAQPWAPRRVLRPRGALWRLDTSVVLRGAVLEPPCFLRLCCFVTRAPSRSVSAHFEAAAATVLTSAAPPLLFDYYEFPASAYELKWPAPGATTLAARVTQLLDAAGIPTATGSPPTSHGDRHRAARVCSVPRR